MLLRGESPAERMSMKTSEKPETVAACWYGNAKGERICGSCWRRTRVWRDWTPETRTPVGSTCTDCGEPAVKVFEIPCPACGIQDSHAASCPKLGLS